MRPATLLDSEIGPSCFCPSTYPEIVVAVTSILNVRVVSFAHAPSKVTVAVELDPQDVRLRIVDDGVGLPPDAENKTNCYGLRGMRERVEALGGSLLLDNIESGTLVEVVLPRNDREVLKNTSQE